MHDPVDTKWRGSTLQSRRHGGLLIRTAISPHVFPNLLSSLGFNQGIVQSPIRLVEGSCVNERRSVRFLHRMIGFMYRKQGFLDRCRISCTNNRHLPSCCRLVTAVGNPLAKEKQRVKQTPP